MGNRISFKSSVSVVSVQCVVFDIIIAAFSVSTLLGYDLIVTSISDGTHKIGSKHYIGEAVDIRTFHMFAEDRRLFVSRLQSILGSGFDVVLEKDHIHVERDCK